MTEEVYFMEVWKRSFSAVDSFAIEISLSKVQAEITEILVFYSVRI